MKKTNSNHYYKHYLRKTNFKRFPSEQFNNEN